MVPKNISLISQIHAINNGLLRYESKNFIEVGTKLPKEFIQSSQLPAKIIQKLIDSQNEYLIEEKLTLTEASWNVNGGIGKYGSSLMFKDLEHWLLFPQRINPQYIQSSSYNNSDLEKPSDIYVIGFQEIVNLKTKNVLKNSNQSLDQWHVKILNSITSYARHEKYVLVGKKQLFGIGILVYIKLKFAPFIK